MRFVRETGTGVRSRCAWDIKECKGRLGKHLDAIIYLLYHSMEENLRRNPSISIARHTASTQRNCKKSQISSPSKCGRNLFK